MAEFGLPDHLMAWIEDQIGLGQARSVGGYLADLAAQERLRQSRLAARRGAISDARGSGISMQAVDTFLARWLTQAAPAPEDQLKTAIRDGRTSGTSHSSLEAILARALTPHVTEVARAA